MIGVHHLLYQGPPKTSAPHYDITGLERVRALKLGAVACNREQIVAVFRRVKVRNGKVTRPRRAPPFPSQGQGDGLSRLDNFVPPAPSNWLIRAMTPVNRAVMLKGFAGLRGVCDIRTIDFPEGEQAKACRCLRRGQGDFIAPTTRNSSPTGCSTRRFPRASARARRFGQRTASSTGSVTRAEILARQQSDRADSGNSEPAREHSIDWALKGNVVLLHPEGAVGWHGNYVAPLMPGAVEMALKHWRGRAADPGFQAWSRLSSGSWYSSATSKPNFLTNAPMSKPVEDRARRGAVAARCAYTGYTRRCWSAMKPISTSKPSRRKRFADRHGLLVESDLQNARRAACARQASAGPNGIAAPSTAQAT